MICNDDKIVTAYAEYASGPGWVNRPIWVIVRGADMALREECIQPEDHTPELLALFDVSSAVQVAMTAAVSAATGVIGRHLEQSPPLVCIEWNDPESDWQWFRLIELRGEWICLQGADYPDGSAKHDGGTFWVHKSEVRAMSCDKPEVE